MEEAVYSYKPVKLFNIQKLIHWYQPIFNLETESVLGYEALVRDKSPNGFSPIEIFKLADQENCRNSLDRQLLFAAFNSIKSIKKTDVCMLFLNVFPSTLLEPDFLPWWIDNFTGNSSVVLEITENEPVSDWSKLKYTVYELRNIGIKIALDDMGAGYSSFRRWIELDPDYIKLDRYYAIDLAQSFLKQRVLKSLITLFENNTKVILEGIEMAKDLEMAKSLGISFAQGFLLGKPSPLEY